MKEFTLDDFDYYRETIEGDRVIIYDKDTCEFYDYEAQEIIPPHEVKYIIK